MTSQGSNPTREQIGQRDEGKLWIITRKLFVLIVVKQPQVTMKLKKNLDIAIWAMDELLCSRGVANAELKNAARMDEQYISRVGEIVKHERRLK